MLTSPRHEAISSTLSDAGDIDKYLGMYSPAITTGTMHRIMQRDPGR